MISLLIELFDYFQHNNQNHKYFIILDNPSVLHYNVIICSKIYILEDQPRAERSPISLPARPHITIDKIFLDFYPHVLREPLSVLEIRKLLSTKFGQQQHTKELS